MPEESKVLRMPPPASPNRASNAFLESIRRSAERRRMEGMDWVALGNAPYHMERVVNRSPGFLDRFISATLRELSAEDSAYIKENLAEIGVRRKTRYISPALYALILARAVEQFGKRSEPAP